MRTADTIAQQAEAKTKGKTENKESLRKKRCAQLKPYQFQPGQSGNPGGRPKHDTARQIARSIFQNNEEEIYNALGKALLKGNAYVFKELAERGFGKLKEHMEVSDADRVVARLAEGRKRARTA